MKFGKLLTLLMALMLTLSLAACGGNGGGDSSALTEEEYQQEVENLTAELSSVQSDASALDPSDIEGAKQVLEDLKAPFQDFMALTPPEAYAEAHEKLQSGCQAMVDFLDTTASLMEETDPTALQAGTEKLMSSLETAVTDMTEGATMLDTAANS